MRVEEFLTEGILYRDVFPDGHLIISTHLSVDRAYRNILTQYVVNMAKRAAQRYKKELTAIGDGEDPFILENPKGLRVAILKKASVEYPGQYVYWVKTAADNLKMFAGERVFKIR
jgi:hypothetical protein